MGNPTRQKLIAIVEPVCLAAGYELVDIEYTRGPQGWVVRVFIDHPEQPEKLAHGSVGFDDCERISRELGPVLDVEDPIPHAYSLEVSSPGIDRPLRTKEHFRRYLGQVAKVSLARTKDGRRNFKGKLVSVSGANGTTVITMGVDGKEYELPLADIASANLVPNWDELMSQGKRPGTSRGTS